MSALLSGVGLLLLALFMLIGFSRSSAELSSLPTLVALMITVVLPAGGGLALITRHFRYGKRLEGRRELLRLQTVESEVLRLAAQRAGRLTVVEIVTEMAIPTELAQSALDSLLAREIADIAVTDSGVLVYTFHDVQRLGEKSGAKDVLE